MKESYQIVDKGDNRRFSAYLAKNAQLLMPMVELVKTARMAIDELIDVLGRASIEAVVQLLPWVIIMKRDTKREIYFDI